MQPEPSSPFQPPPRTQFGLRTILWVTSVLCGLFALLGALQVSVAQALIGFAAIGGVSLASVAVVEWVYRRRD